MDLRLTPGVDAPRKARRSLEVLRPSLDGRLADDAALLVSEVVTNAVRHADLGPDDAIEVRVGGSRSVLHVDVIDPGAGFDPGRVRGPKGDDGWGMWLLDRISSDWGVERSDVTRVWFELASPVSTDVLRGTSG